MMRSCEYRLTQFELAYHALGCTKVHGPNVSSRHAAVKSTINFWSRDLRRTSYQDACRQLSTIERNKTREKEASLELVAALNGHLVTFVAQRRKACGTEAPAAPLQTP